LYNPKFLKIYIYGCNCQTLKDNWSNDWKIRQTWKEIIIIRKISVTEFRKNWRKIIGIRTISERIKY